MLIFNKQPYAVCFFKINLSIFAQFPVTNNSSEGS